MNVKEQINAAIKAKKFDLASRAARAHLTGNKLKVALEIIMLLWMAHLEEEQVARQAEANPAAEFDLGRDTVPNGMLTPVSGPMAEA